MWGLKHTVGVLAIGALALAACQEAMKASVTPTPENQVASTSLCPWAGTVPWTQSVLDGQVLTPRAAFLNAIGNPSHYAKIDTGYLMSGWSYLHTFSVTPPAPPAVGILSFRARPFSYPGSQDDGIKLYSGATPALLHQFYFGTTGSTVGAMPNAWIGSNYPLFQNLSYQFTASQLATMVSSGVLDVQIGDHTSLEKITLLLCVAQPTPTPTQTPSPTPTRTPLVVPTAGIATVTGPTTALDAEPATPTPVPTPVATATPVVVPTAGIATVTGPTTALDMEPTTTATPTATDTPTPVPTGTPVPTATAIPAPTDTPVLTSTSTPAPPATPTPLPPSPTPPPTASPTLAPTASPTPTATPAVAGEAQLCIRKFYDVNGNGTRDQNESWLSGWTFSLSPSPPAPAQVTTQGPQGGVCIAVPAPATYTITEQVQTGWLPTTPGQQSISVQPGQMYVVTFGNRR